MKLIATLSAPPDAQGKAQPVALTVQGIDDTGAELLTLAVHDASKIAAILPRLTALAQLLPKAPQK